MVLLAAAEHVIFLGDEVHYALELLERVGELLDENPVARHLREVKVEGVVGDYLLREMRLVLGVIAILLRELVEARELLLRRVLDGVDEVRVLEYIAVLVHVAHVRQRDLRDHVALARKDAHEFVAHEHRQRLAYGRLARLVYLRELALRQRRPRLEPQPQNVLLQRYVYVVYQTAVVRAHPLISNVFMIHNKFLIEQPARPAAFTFP